MNSYRILKLKEHYCYKPFFYISIIMNVVYINEHIFKMEISLILTRQQSKHMDISINRYNINTSCNQNNLKFMFIEKMKLF